ncbi:MAG: alpha-L-fucosidase [Bacteroidetes bacterium]|nr:alpha-L-fucosidase [Bacteroidota bacterium]
MKNLLLSLPFLLFACAKPPVPPPAPFGPVPSEAQLNWQQMEFNAFVHFNMNTFTNQEWGTGAEPPKLFNPTALDCRQWVQVCKEAGMGGIILTAKHHDGFCLWPSEFTEHSVKNSPWKDGKGDMVRELADACREQGLKMGVYLSPWDRNHAGYGKTAYLDYFRNQLKELLTKYGDIFEVWFDGANGGTGYYGGANETRTVDRQNYYDWPTTQQIVKELQPNAVIFSDAGPGCRWVGNEEGFAGETNWSTLRRDEFYPGSPNYQELTTGHADGTHWVPAECDVSIRPGWYYHPEQDTAVKSLEKLTDIYYNSVGRNGLLLLNLPVDARGLVNEADAQRLKELGKAIRADFANDLAKGKPITATDERGRGFEAKNALDENRNTYWATGDSILSASVEIDFGKKTAISRLVLQEYIRLGQRVSAFRVFVFNNEKWEPLASGTTVGYKRILRFEKQEAEKVKIEFDGRAALCISTIGVY